VLISIGMVLVQLLVGALGEIFPYRYVSLGFATVAFTCILIFIVRNKEDVRHGKHPDLQYKVAMFAR
jgi:hypothetical protein